MTSDSLRLDDNLLNADFRNDLILTVFGETNIEISQTDCNNHRLHVGCGRSRRHVIRWVKNFGLWNGPKMEAGHSSGSNLSFIRNPALKHSQLF